MKRAGGLVALLTLGLWLNNTSLFIAVPENQRPGLLAHRGVHQIYAGSDRDAETCTANPIKPPQHDYIANTLRSMEAAFRHGADVVELDVHLTTDGVFAVFHDWTLDCQTDGTGVTHKQAYGDLRGLDLGYGYTPDGKSYPLRGTGVGQMPTLVEVLAADLGGRYLVNFKSNRAEEGDQLVLLLETALNNDQIFGVYGGAAPTQTALGKRPDMIGFDRPSLKDCLASYMLIGWSGHVPMACQNTLVAIPMDYAPFLWGWPDRFMNRMETAGTKVILWGPYDGSGFSSGIDTPEALEKVPHDFGGLIWTNKIEVIGPLLATRNTR